MKQLNNKIQESYCSFEVSKLLKEKDFNISSQWLYTKEGILSGTKMSMNGYPNNYEEFYSRPTHALAIEWIRVNFDIHMSIDNLIDNKYYFSYRNIGTTNYVSRSGYTEDGYDSPHEATESSLLYILQNFIP